LSEPQTPAIDTASLWQLLYQDIDWTAAERSLPPQGKERRTLVRAVFAAIEGTLFRIKDTLLELARSRLVSFSPAETALLREEDCDLTQEGEVRIFPARLRFLPNLRFTLLMTHRASKSVTPIDYSGTGWQQLLVSVKVRDRLMHPKQPADLTVTDDEVASLRTAMSWFRDNVVSLLDDTQRRIRSLERP
jgi:hypothetical protein